MLKVIKKFVYVNLVVLGAFAMILGIFSTGTYVYLYLYDYFTMHFSRDVSDVISLVIAGSVSFSLVVSIACILGEKNDD